MSNSTDLPDLNKLEAYATSSKNGDWHATEAMLNMLDEDDVLALVAAARRVESEFEAPQAGPLSEMQVDRIVRAYFSEQWAVQHAKDAIHDAFEDSRKSASLSPLCGAQHAESSKESVRRHEAIEAAVDQCYPKQDSAPPSVNDKIGAARLAFRKGYRAALHRQQSAAPRTDLSERIRAAATSDVTLVQAKLLICAAEEIERAQLVAAPTWGAVHTVGNMVRNLLTLDQAAPIFTAFHVTIDGERRCRTRGVTISKERVVDGKWIDSARKDVPYTHIIWAKPDDWAQLVAAPGAMDPDELTRMRRLMSALGHTDAFELSDEYVRGVLCTVLGQAAGELERTRLSAALGNTPEFGGIKTSAPGTPKAPQTAAARDVLAERQRQVSIGDWTPEHDDAHPCGEIAAFAALYAMPGAARDWPATETGYGDTFGAALCPEDWQPKFGDRRRELVKAGALVLAEIERMDRAAAPKGGA